MELVRAVIRDLVKRRKELRRLVAWTFVLATIFALTASGSDYLRDVMSEAPSKAPEFWDHLLWMIF